MTITEFLKGFCLHDSLLEKVEFDSHANIVTLTIDFCFWMQDWYDTKKFPETGLILVHFLEVTNFVFEDRVLNRDSIDGIELLGENDLVVKIYDRDYFEIRICAQSVEVKMLHE